MSRCVEQVQFIFSRVFPSFVRRTVDQRCANCYFTFCSRLSGEIAQSRYEVHPYKFIYISYLI